MLSPVCLEAYTSAMLSPKEIATAEAAIAVLEKSLDSCTDSGIRELIGIWLEDQKKKLKGDIP